jgi:hypothetical protein
MNNTIRLVNLFILTALAAIAVDIFYDSVAFRYTGIKASPPELTKVIEKIMGDKIVLNLNGQNQVLPLENYQSRGRSRYASRAVRRTGNSVRTQRRLIWRAHIDKAAANIGDLMTQAKLDYLPGERKRRANATGKAMS